MNSPDFSHDSPSQVPGVDGSFLRTQNFRKRFLTPLCARLCRQQLCLRWLAGTSAAFGRQEAFQSRESRLKPTVTRITQILWY